MRIAWLITQSTDDPSGMGRFLPIAKQTAKLGYAISLIALHPSYTELSPDELRYTSDGVDVRYVAQSYFVKSGNSKSYFSPIRLLSVSFTGAVAIARIIRQIKPHIIHLGKPHPISGLALALLGFPPYYLDCDDYETYSNRFGGKWQRWLVRLFENALPRRAQLITTNTTFMRDRLLKMHCREPYLIPNAVDRARFAPAVELSRQQARAHLGLSSDNLLVVYLGTLSLINHPVDLLITAFRDVLAEMPNARLAIVGAGEDAGKLERLGQQLGIADCIQFTGRVPRQVAPFWLRAADITVDPVHADLVAHARSPLKVLESLAVHTPCVAGNVGDRKFILQPDQLVQPGNAADLARGIIATLRKPPNRWELDVTQAPRLSPLPNKFVRFWDEALDDLAEIYPSGK